MKITVGLSLAAVSAAYTRKLRVAQPETHSLVKMWEWEQVIDDSYTDSNGDEQAATTTQTITFRGDVGASNDFPLGWDEVDLYYLAQSVSLWAGGE